MKKIIVGVLTVIAILVLLCLSGALKNMDSSRSATALMGSTQDGYFEGKMGRPENSPSAAPQATDALEDMKMEEKPVAAAAPNRRMDKAKKESMNGLFGSAVGDSSGLGGLGLKGAGSGGGGIGYGTGRGSIGSAPAKAAHGTSNAKQKGKDANKADQDGEEEGQPAPTRAWFPETFLFEPLVVTDASGHATVPVRVPDRLTNWRVLALAHSRQGSQAGASTQFLGTLATYVEPVVPPFLYAGDSVRVPVQVVNTTDRDISSALAYQAVGATLSTAGGNVKVPGGGNAVQYVTMNTSRPGTAGLKTTLGTTDAIERTIEVKPAGAPVTVSRGGTLAAPREFSLVAPANALPDSESVRLQVFPGALGLLRSELSAAPNRGGIAEDAYLLNLLGQAPSLLKSLGAESDPAVIRDLSIIGTQRVMRYSRSPSVDDATLLARAAMAHPENPVLTRLAERLAMQIAQAQRPDGTCQGANGWTLQRLLVTTSDCVRTGSAAGNSPQAVQRATLMKVKAAGAIERNLARVTDGYTAAALLASGAASGTVADTLKALVLKSVTAGEDGAQFLTVDNGVVRSDGRTPSQVEATAMAIIALKDDPKAPLADLGTYLLSNYSPYGGWGDGRTNLLAMEAVTQLFRDPVPANVKITLKRDGKEITSGQFNAQRLQDVVTLAVPAVGSAGTHTWSITAEPAVPGLGYTLALTSYVKWVADTGSGLELTTKLPEGLKVGQSAQVSLVAAAPSGFAPVMRISLPAGVQTDSVQLDKLVESSKLTSYETEDGAVTLHLPPFASGGALFQENLTVIPTLAGKLTSAPSSMKVDGRVPAKNFAPLVWNIAG